MNLTGGCGVHMILVPCNVERDIARGIDNAIIRHQGMVNNVSAIGQKQHCADCVDVTQVCDDMMMEFLARAGFF